MAVQGLRLKLNQKGIRELLQSDEVQADLQRRVDRIAAATGAPDDYDARVDVIGGTSKLGRAMGRVVTATFEARKAEAQDRTLTRALDAGR